MTLCWIVPVRRYASSQLWILKVRWVRMGTVAPVHPMMWLVRCGYRNRNSLRLHQAAARNHWEPDRRMLVCVFGRFVIYFLFLCRLQKNYTSEESYLRGGGGS